MQLLTKKLHPSVPSCYIGIRKTGEHFPNLPCCLHTFGMAFREELVGIAHYLLFKGFRREITVGKRKSLLLDGLTGKPCSRVPFRHSGMERQPLGTKDFSTKPSMADIGMRAMATYAGSIRMQDTYVVKHRRFIDELSVHLEFWMLVQHLHGPVCHLARMLHEQVHQFVLTCIVFPDKFFGIHDFKEK